MKPLAPSRADEIVVPTVGNGVDESPSLLAWLSTLLDNRRAIIVIGLIGGLAAAGYKLLQPRTFSAHALAIMDSQSSGSVLSGLTASLGLSPIQTDGSPTPAFYADLIITDLVLGSAVDSTYRYASNGSVKSGTLIELFNTSGATPALRREHAIAHLKKLVGVRVAQKTGAITVTVTTHEAALSPLIVARLIAEVNRVNILSRQSQASGEREFTGRRVQEAAQELRTAENQLQDFLQRNRDYASAPTTAFEEDRLARAVAMRQSIYTSVSQAYEQARIQEARDTPGLRVVEPAITPVLPNSRGLLGAFVLGVCAGAVVGICWALWRDYLDITAQRDPAEMGRFQRSLRAARRDFTRPWRLFVRRS